MTLNTWIVALAFGLLGSVSTLPDAQAATHKGAHAVKSAKGVQAAQAGHKAKVTTKKVVKKKTTKKVKKKVGKKRAH
ncbi:hypothetical protein [Inhella gelatinilytica]|uniref:Uncharacterized protein n=1 Tax=Inhella gelatinilytica TaxID=2795030 RepID=A0A931NC97_9BURK|nr:hypothetical protein [Inhella gelatinilytica]MBH9551344.1 hypothetical protein [Inhella gelatinilytica]